MENIDISFDFGWKSWKLCSERENNGWEETAGNASVSSSELHTHAGELFSITVLINKPSVWSQRSLLVSTHQQHFSNSHYLHRCKSTFWRLINFQQWALLCKPKLNFWAILKGRKQLKTNYNCYICWLTRTI